jgi:hypothetical protein
MNPPKKVNPKHVELARKINIFLGLIILCMFAFAFYFFFPQIKTYTTNFFQKHSFSLFSKSPTQILATIRKDVLPSIVQIRCASVEGGPEDAIGSGIYYLDGTSSTPTVQTNAHVVLGTDGIYHGCNVYFPYPDTGAFYESSYKAGDAFAFNNSISFIDGKEVNGLDIAQLVLTAPNEDEKGVAFVFPPKAKDVFGSVGKLCKKEGNIEIGAKIYMIGYPGIGGDSITLTDGVVSGFTVDGLLKISATSNHGASGGIAIGQDDGCYYGIIESGTEEKGSNLAFSIPSGMINSFLENVTDRKTYVVPATTTSAKSYMTNNISVAKLKFKYPKDWVVSTTTDPKTGLTITNITSPVEGALDTFLEGIVISPQPLGKLSEKEIIKKNVVEELKYVEDVKANVLDKWNLQLDKQTTIYQILYFDKEGLVYKVPSYILDSFFVRDGYFYYITGMAGNDATSEQYMHIYDEFFKAIRF